MTLPDALRERLMQKFEDPTSGTEPFFWLCRALKIPTFTPIISQIDLEAVKSLGVEWCEKNLVLPLFRGGMYLTIVMARPWSGQELDILRDKTYDSIRVLGLDSRKIRNLLDLVRTHEFITTPKKVERLEVAPIIGWGLNRDDELVDDIIRNAYTLGASDVHIEPMTDRVAVKFRINGVLVIQEPIEVRYYDNLIRTFKIKAGLQEIDKTSPKDGRFSVTITKTKTIDLRLAIVPMPGERENVVLRLLDPENILKRFGQLPFKGKYLGRFRDALNAESGLMIITGPTGSGKTTLLYSALTSLDLAKLNVRTVEDPVEYRLDKVVQTQANPKADFGFAKALRIMMRADPDVILVGEVRDEETAKLTVDAANTGHLVLATLHTNDAAAAVPRLKSLGLTNQEIAQSLTIVVAQRLIPKLCPTCKYAVEVTDGMVRHFEANKHFGLQVPTKTYKCSGCPECNYTGTGGRVPIFEFFYVTPTIRDMIANNVDLLKLKEENEKEWSPLLVDAMQQVVDGHVNYDEISCYEPNWSHYNG